MSKIIGLCGDLLSTTRAAALTRMKDQSVGLAHHRQIYLAIKEGDEDLASTLMKHHLTEAYKNVQGDNEK